MHKVEIDPIELAEELSLAEFFLEKDQSIEDTEYFEEYREKVDYYTELITNHCYDRSK